MQINVLRSKFLPGSLFMLDSLLVRNFVVSNGPNELEFEIHHIDPSILNSIRRAMISEVPTVAIEKVFMINNTSVIPDEVLAHRLGLIPISVETSALSSFIEGSEFNEKNHLKFQLKAEAKETKSVLSDEIHWVPVGMQSSRLSKVNVETGIIAVKLAPGQAIDCELIATKGIGQDHAKWSPVSCSMYRNLLKISFLKKELCGDEAIAVRSFFSPGVIGIDSKGKAFVQNAKLSNQSPEYLKGSEVSHLVTIERIENSFQYKIETTTVYEPVKLFIETCKVLQKKCIKLLSSI
jgi:DNA-directed RNA polymerase I and III subunit RPAC1